MMLASAFHLLYGIPFLGLILAKRSRGVVSSTLASMIWKPSEERNSIHPPWDFPEIPLSFINNNTSPKTIHVIVLIHGWMGNSQELSVLQSYLIELGRRRNSSKNDTHFVVYSVTSNEGRTMDGIAAGGGRCAEEIKALLKHVSQFSSPQNPPISLSIIGNSLGGLYARYALRCIQWSNDEIRPAVFSTICTPHLGVGTPHLPILPIPLWMQTAVAQILGPTGRDLFRIRSPALLELYQPADLQALRRFRRRLAVANLHQTDLQVPGTTAAFLVHPSDDDVPTTRHFSWTPPIHCYSKGSGVSFMVETSQSSPSDTVLPQMDVLDRVASSNAMAHQLDQLGWVKIFCDMRPHLPSFFGRRDSVDDAMSQLNDMTTHRLWTKCTETSHYTLPLGHTMLVANAKNPFYARVHQAGRPTMEHLAQLLIHEICDE